MAGSDGLLQAAAAQDCAELLRNAPLHLLHSSAVPLWPEHARFRHFPAAAAGAQAWRLRSCQSHFHPVVQFW